MTKIIGIENLISELEKTDLSSFKEILENFEIDLAELQQYLFWEKGKYTRNCVHLSEKFELLLLCWDENLVTTAHYHAGQQGWLKVIQGKIKEIIIKNDQKTVTSENIYFPNNVTYIDDELGLHILESIGEKSISLHVYAKPLTEVKYLDEEKVLKNAQLSYHSINGTLN